MEDLAESAAREEGILMASLMLCPEHADAFKPPITWTFTDNRSQTGDEADNQATDDLAANDQTIRRAGLSLAHSDMEDTPLLQRAFRSISG